MQKQNAVQNPRSIFLNRRLGLQTVLVVPFILQIFAAVGITGYLSLRNGQKAVNQLVHQLQQEVSDRVEQHLDTYLALPPQMTQLNLDAIAQNQLSINDLERSGRYFWKQSQVFPQFSFTGYYLTNKTGAGAGHWLNGQGTVISYHPPGLTDYTYATDAQGNRTNVVYQTQYDPTAEEWYAEMRQAGQPFWTQVSVEEDFDNYTAIAFVAPIYDSNRQLLGGLTIDLLLSDITRFLKQIQVTPSSQILLLERDGQLIGSSKMQSLVSEGHNPIERYRLATTSDPLQRAIAQALQQKSLPLTAIQSRQEIELFLNGERQYIQITPWQDKYGLDWLVVVATPESDFMGEIHANTRSVIWLCMLAFAIATLIGILTARWIARPILKLQQTSERLATSYIQGEVIKPAAIASSIHEIESLARSFTQMAMQIQSSFQQLAESGQQQVAELAKANAEIKQCLDVLATEPDTTSLIAQILKTIATQLQAPLVEYWTHGADNFVYVEKLYCSDRHYSKTHIQRDFPSHPGLVGYRVSDDLFEGESLYRRQHSVLIENLSTSTLADINYWHQERSVQKFLSMPLIFGEYSIGAIAVYLRAEQSFTPNHLEFVRALTHLATLAIKLTQLAEESRQFAIIQDRNHLAREIHDTLAQGYAGILMQLQAAHLLQHQPEQLQVHLDRARSLARDGVTDARRSVWLLQQDNGAYQDVAGFLVNLVERLRIDHPIQPTVTIQGEPQPVNPDVGLHLFRIAQESITNVLRHAQANKLDICLTYHPERLQMIIQDDGCGFEHETLTNGFGIKGMRQRAELIGAELQIHSQRDRGTCVELSISLV
jgi:signal transduction histidine kinase